MKRKFLLILALAFTSIVLAQNYTGSIVFSEGIMKESNDSLHFSINIEVENAAVISSEGMRFIPTLSDAEHFLEMPDVMFQGKNKNKSWKRSKSLMNKKQRANFNWPTEVIKVTKKGRTLYSYVFKAPYELWMDNAKMTIYQELISYQDKRGIISYAFDDKVQIASREPYSIQPSVQFIKPTAETKVRKYQGQAYLDFQIGQSVILPNFRRNPEELQKIRSAFNEVIQNKEVQIKGLFIEGYASPDGSYKGNNRLARDRALALKNYIIEHFNLNLTSDQIKVAWTAEDWLGLRSQVEERAMTREQEVIQLIDNVSDIEQRKAQLKSLAGGSTYRMLVQQVFPSLRRVEYQIDYAVRDFSTDEAKDFMHTNSDLMSHLELYNVAQTYEVGSAEYNEIMLELIPNLFTNDPVAHVNAAAVMILRGEWVTAKRYLERYRNDSIVWNNLGLVYLLEGDFSMARSLLEQAMDKGVVEAEHNLKELEKKISDSKKR